MIGIYKITNKINNKIYIGQSVDIEKRWETHKFYSKDDTVLQKALKKYGIFNFNFEIIEECDANELNDKEKYWIKYYSSDIYGYNMTPGGQGFQESSNFNQIRDLYVKEHNSIHNISNKEKISRITVRKALDQASILHKDTSIPVVIEMYDINTLQLIKIFPSIVDGAEYATVSEAAIRKALSSPTHYSGGYLWKRSGDNTILIPYRKNSMVKGKEVIQYDLNKNIIAIYPSISKANEAMGKGHSATLIKEVCQNKRFSAYGYLWKYKEK